MSAEKVQSLSAGAAPDFERLAALERGAGRRYGLGAVLLLAGGLVAAAAGLALAGPDLTAAVPGLLAAALAALPWREALERRDRAQGLLVLEEEWAALPADDLASRERLVTLIEVMFGVARGPDGLETEGGRA